MSCTMVSLRKDRNLTQEMLAKEIGVTKGAIGMYELGKRTPSLKRAKQIADFFNVSVDEIVFSNK